MYVGERRRTTAEQDASCPRRRTGPPPRRRAASSRFPLRRGRVPAPGRACRAARAPVAWVSSTSSASTSAIRARSVGTRSNDGATRRRTARSLRARQRPEPLAGPPVVLEPVIGQPLEVAPHRRGRGRRRRRRAPGRSRALGGRIARQAGRRRARRSPVEAPGTQSVELPMQCRRSAAGLAERALLQRLAVREPLAVLDRDPTALDLEAEDAERPDDDEVELGPRLVAMGRQSDRVDREPVVRRLVAEPSVDERLGARCRYGPPTRAGYICAIALRARRRSRRPARRASRRAGPVEEHVHLLAARLGQQRAAVACGEVRATRRRSPRSRCTPGPRSTTRTGRRASRTRCSKRRRSPWEIEPAQASGRIGRGGVDQESARVVARSTAARAATPAG